MRSRFLVAPAVAIALFVGAVAWWRPSPALDASPIAVDAPSRAIGAARGVPIDADSRARSAGASSDSATGVSIPDGPVLPVGPGEEQQIEIVLQNQSKSVWRSDGAEAVKLSYHLYDAAGKLLAWDGLRTTLPYDIAPGNGGTFLLRVSAPVKTGTYSVRPDLIRDGLAWLGVNGKTTAFPLRVSTDLDVTYEATTAPASIVPGGQVPIEVTLRNSGLRVWPAAGDHPIHLSYHWFDMSSQAVVWDGVRALLPHDVVPGDQVKITLDVRAPQGPGAYALAWDMVDEGRGWFSRAAVPMKEDLVVVQNSVTFYGKGWGHGIGFSQWGAQGWAEGATGVRLDGEQIVARYFPKAQLSTQPETLPFRVLLSAPSTGCVRRTIWNTANMRSEGGMRLVNDADPSVVYLDAAPGQSVRFSVYRGTTLVAVDGWSGRVVFAGENDTLALVPKQWWDPISISEKGLAYRGNIQVQVREEGNLRVVNYVGSDDYMRGALPGEVPSDWEMEALRAQAITARTYAAWRQSTAGDRTWDVRDDTADQCYGGHSFESPRTTMAVLSTPATILTYQGKPIRALYSSANGGITENVGCVLDAEKVGTTWKCADGWPYLEVIEDPAELAAYDRRGYMPHGSWERSFSGDVIRREIIIDYGVDIGSFVSMEFNMSPGGRPLSVRIRGTAAWVDLKGDRFLRETLGMKSTLVRMIPF